MSASYKVSCTCKNDFQDKEYGKHIRIATPRPKKNANDTTREVRCTVCATIHTVKA
jgi:hypothetical protein